MKGLLLVLLLMIAAPAAADPVRVTVTRQGDGFVADFTLPADAPAWGFWRSSTAAADKQSWRAKSWRVMTPGVTLQRRGQQDALVGAGSKPVPRRLRVRLVPFTGDLNGDYVPALRLGAGSIAVFDGHFALFSVDSPAMLDSLKPGFDPSLRGIGDFGTAVTFKGSNLRLAGDIDGYRRGESAGTYGLFGVPRAVIRNNVATVIDGEMPGWIADYLSGFAPRVIDALTEGLGPAGIGQPTILAAWEGSGTDGASMNGGTLKGLILMRFEGKAALKEIPALRNMARWFVAHEAAHFWLGQAVTYGTPRDSWIMEGGADLLAMRTVAGLDPSFDSRTMLNDALRDCARLATRPVATAIERGEQRAYYACGAIFSLIAEKAHGGNFFAFTRGLIASNQDDKTVDSADWISSLVAVSRNPELGRDIGALLDRGDPRPDEALARMLQSADIPHVRDANGVPQL